MFLYFFIISLISVRAEVNSLWLEAGCTSDGVLSPKKVPHFWNTIPDHESFIQQIITGAEAGDRLSITSCYGEEEVLALTKQTEQESYSKTFHLLWECPEGEAACMLPPVHALCIRTLRSVHPQATIYLWSMTLNPTLMGAFLDEIDVELKHYDSGFFEGLPPAAVAASQDIKSFFKSEKDAYSHWSDLFRAAVLYKFGGVYTDLDSIWLRPIDQVSQATSWIPSTPTTQEQLEEMDVITLGSKRLFLEGGILRFDEPKSPFLWRVLSEFPKYTQEIAECWACVGPRQLTTTFNAFLEENAELPDLVDSQSVFGLKNYRNYFHEMHSLFDPKIFYDTLTSNVVAAHMFSGTPQDGISRDSTIFHFFQAAGVDDIVTKVSASWREVKERRGLLSSLYYLANTLTDQTANANALTQAQVQQFYGSAFMIGDQTVNMVQNAYLSEAIQGQGSVVFYAGEAQSVTSEVSLTCPPTDAQIAEIRNIYYSGFNVPLASVHATAASSFTVDVVVDDVDIQTMSSDAALVSLFVTQSNNLCNGVVTEMNLPQSGYTEAVITIEYDALDTGEHLAAQFVIIDIFKLAFDVDPEDLDTTTVYKATGQLSCAVSGDSEPDASVYEELLSAQLGGGEATYDLETDTFSVVAGTTFNDAINVRYMIANNSPDFAEISGFCYWDESHITVVSTNVVREVGVTYTQMETQMNVAIEAFLENGLFRVPSAYVITEGTQSYGACALLEECQNDYNQLYEASVGDLSTVPLEDTVEISWWWRFQLGQTTQLSVDIDEIRLHNQRFYYHLGDGTYADTCIQHEPTWINPCDTSIGVCAGTGNFGYASQQTAALNAALAQSSKRHPNCPYGCQSLRASDKTVLYNNIVSANNNMENHVSLAEIDGVCLLNDKYYVYSSPTLLLDTCVGYNENELATCALSYYTFCSDITDSGYVVYGDATAQGQALTQALLTAEKRHPSCI